jgi:transcriptional regulator with XRE-family HTH domain
MTADDVRQIIRERLEGGTQVALARKLKITPAYLSDILSGARDPGRRVLRALGLGRTVEYYPVRSRKGQASV